MEVFICIAFLVVLFIFVMALTKRAFHKVDKDVVVSREFFTAAMDVHRAFCTVSSKAEKNQVLPGAILNLDRAVREMQKAGDLDLRELSEDCRIKLADTL